jgi:hypothetical protein
MALNYVIIVPLGARSPEYPYPRTVQASMAGHAPTLIRSAIPPSTDIPAYDDPLLGVSLSTARRDVPVTDGNSLAAALLNAQPGDTIILEEGRTYTQNESIRAIGTATQPIIIKGSTGAAWNGVVRLYGQYIYLMGVDLSTGAEGVVVLAGFCNKILACKFGNQEASNAISLDRVVDVPDNRGGRYGEIAYCDFGTQGPNPPWQPGDDFPGFRQQIKMFTDSVYNSVHIDGWIHHNNFHDSHPKADPGTYSSGDNDIIEFGEGDSQEWVYTLSTNWYVEYNIFQNNNNAGNALIDFKTRGNICRGNTCIGNFSQGFWSRTGGAIQYMIFRGIALTILIRGVRGANIHAPSIPRLCRTLAVAIFMLAKNSLTKESFLLTQKTR